MKKPKNSRGLEKCLNCVKKISTSELEEVMNNDFGVRGDKSMPNLIKLRYGFNNIFYPD